MPACAGKTVGVDGEDGSFFFKKKQKFLSSLENPKGLSGTQSRKTGHNFE